MARDREAIRTLQSIADKARQPVRADFLAAIEALRRSVNWRRIVQVLESRDQFAIHAMVDSLPSRLQRMVRKLDRVYEATAHATVRQLAKNGIGMRFDLVDQAMVLQARQHGARLVVEVTQETRRAIREIVARSFSEGITPRDTAKLLREVVGLTSRQAKTVLKYRRALVKRGVSPADVERRTAAYGKRLVRQRAMVIARTETIAAATRGQLETWRVAQRVGLLPQAAMKVWITTPDDRLCRFCRAMDGQLVPLNAQFAGWRGYVDGPPLHPRCRCAVAVRAIEMPKRRVA